MACSSGNLVIDHQRGLVHGIVLGLIAQTGIWLNYDAQMDKLTERPT